MFKHIGYCILAIIISGAVCNSAWADRGIQFFAHDEKNSGYPYPTFKFSVKLPDGSLIGWNKGTGQWTGAIKKSQIIQGTFDYPYPDIECTSTEPLIERDINLPPDIVGEYSTRNALYCTGNGVNSFIGSGIAAIIGRVPDGKVEVTLYPEANAIIFACFDFLVGNLEPLNVFCNVEKYNSRIVIAPGTEQKVEMNYDFSSEEKTTVEKVVTPATLSGSWESCYKLGLIKNSGLFNSVQKKLENAKRKHDEGSLEAAAGIYGALVNELKAQYGKGIDAQCADILIEDMKKASND